MNVLDVITNRHGYRGEYNSVLGEDLITIMKAGSSAPSGCNKQTTSLTAVDDKETLNKLRDVIDPPVRIAKTEPTTPDKKAFEDRAWFNSFQNK